MSAGNHLWCNRSPTAILREVQILRTWNRGLAALHRKRIEASLFLSKVHNEFQQVGGGKKRGAPLRRKSTGRRWLKRSSKRKSEAQQSGGEGECSGGSL